MYFLRKVKNGKSILKFNQFGKSFYVPVKVISEEDKNITKEIYNSLVSGKNNELEIGFSKSKKVLYVQMIAKNISGVDKKTLSKDLARIDAKNKKVGKIIIDKKYYAREAATIYDVEYFPIVRRYN